MAPVAPRARSKEVRSVHLILTPEGAGVLEAVLIEHLEKLRAEIARPDGREREHLQRRELFLRKILQQMATQSLSRAL